MTDIDEQTSLVDKLTACYSTGKRLLYELEDQGHPAAPEVKKTTEQLGLEIEALLKNLYQTWSGNAATVGKQISKTNSDLRLVVKKIERRVQVAQNIVKSLSYLEKAARLASRLLK